MGNTMQMSDFNQPPILKFERDFDENGFFQWIQTNWSLSVWYSIVYVIVIWGGRYYMQHRQAFEIRYALAVWSAILGAFSIIGALRTVPEIAYVIKNYGWEYSFCNPSYTKGVSGVWTVLFTVSKVYELGDTVFIVLRKQKLIFLHWYHHITVLIYTWYSYAQHLGPGRWFVTMNYTVHSAMYTYYALRALKIRIPKSVAMSITILQILQMVIGLVVNLQAYRVKSRGDFCQTTTRNLILSSSMYASYFLLFGYFFYTTYFVKKPTPVTSVKKAN